MTVTKISDVSSADACLRRLPGLFNGAGAVMVEHAAYSVWQSLLGLSQVLYLNPKFSTASLVRNRVHFWDGKPVSCRTWIQTPLLSWQRLWDWQTAKRRWAKGCTRIHICVWGREKEGEHVCKRKLLKGREHLGNREEKAARRELWGGWGCSRSKFPDL